MRFAARSFSPFALPPSLPSLSRARPSSCQLHQSERVGEGPWGVFVRLLVCFPWYLFFFFLLAEPCQTCSGGISSRERREAVGAERAGRGGAAQPLGERGGAREADGGEGGVGTRANNGKGEREEEEGECRWGRPRGSRWGAREGGERKGRGEERKGEQEREGVRSPDPRRGKEEERDGGGERCAGRSGREGREGRERPKSPQGRCTTLPRPLAPPFAPPPRGIFLPLFFPSSFGRASTPSWPCWRRRERTRRGRRARG